MEPITYRRGAAVAMVLLFLAVSFEASAREWQVTLEPERSTLTFKLGSTFHTVHGTLKLRSGHLSFDPATGEASGVFRVDAAATDTGNGRRDRKMHRQVLESENYPLIEFQVQQVQGEFRAEGTSRMQLVGNLSIHGASHRFVMPVVVECAGGEMHGRTRFEIPFVDWGMKDPSVLMFRVEKGVKVDVETAGTLTAAGD